MSAIKSLTIEGFKSIGAPVTIQLGTVNILLGANGVGKSNLVSAFAFLGHLMTGACGEYVARNGYANALLHLGAATTPVIRLKACFSNSEWTNEYHVQLNHAISDELYIGGEKIVIQKEGQTPSEKILDSLGSRESYLSKMGELNQTEQVVRRMLSGCRAFQFHDTSSTARLRNSCSLAQDRCLLSNAGNLPAFLFAMKQIQPKYYERIVRRVRSVVPSFGDFVLEPDKRNEQQIFLRWIEEGGQQDYVFGPHQLSDGSLRFIALATLLLQPPATLPSLIVIDEPELGLHPAAIDSLVGMIAIASEQSQILISTQSARLANQFDCEDIIVASYDRKQRTSIFERLNCDKLKIWMDDYTLAELWDKNVIGGRP